MVVRDLWLLAVTPLFSDHNKLSSGRVWFASVINERENINVQQTEGISKGPLPKLAKASGLIKAS